MRYKMHQDSLQAIRAEMPTGSHEWEVECVMEYRCIYGLEQWLIKWKHYGHDRNTWEPMCVCPNACICSHKNYHPGLALH